MGGYGLNGNGLTRGARSFGRDNLGMITVDGQQAMRADAAAESGSK